MNDCIFCKILNNELPGKIEKVTENWATLVPIDPIVEGHILVLPYVHSTNMLDITDEATKNELAEVLKFVANQQKEKYNADGINIRCNNGEAAQQTVPHLHYHIIPRYNGDALDVSMKKE
jgi:histidine triad (HIT) family protein